MEAIHLYLNNSMPDAPLSLSPTPVRFEENEGEMNSFASEKSRTVIKFKPERLLRNFLIDRDRAQDIRDWCLDIMEEASEESYLTSMALFGIAAIHNVACAVQNLFNTFVSLFYIFGKNGFSNLARNFGKTVMNLTNVIGSTIGAFLPHLGMWWTNASIYMVARPKKA